MTESVSKASYSSALGDIIARYDRTIAGASDFASETATATGRRVGGVLRAAKGKLHEWITESLIHAALVHKAGIAPKRIRIDSKKLPIPIKPSYTPLDTHPVAAQALTHRRAGVYFYASVDKHVWVDDRLVAAIECKAYTENAMLKRILVDFRLLRMIQPTFAPLLVQLESMLGGDYCTCAHPCSGSDSTHTLLSHFPDVPLRIITLLEGERKVERPLHEFPKPLLPDRLDAAAKRFLALVAPNIT
jgi:hypothetical protein